MPRIDDLGLRADTAAGWAAAEVGGPATTAGENVWIDNDLVKCDGVTKVNDLPRAGSSTYARTVGSKFRAAAARAAARNAIDLGPLSTPPTLTTNSTTNATGLGLTSSYRLTTSAANLARYRIVGGIGQPHSGGAYYVAWSGSMSDGSGGNLVGDGTKNSYTWAIEWVTDAAWFQIEQMARTAGYQLYVNDQPIRSTNLATSTNYGAGSFTLVDWSVGTATIVAATGVFTSSAAHGLRVGDVVYLGTITSTTGVSANTPYYVITVPSATTFTLSASPGGTALSLTTDGSTARVAKSTTRRYRLEYDDGVFLQLDMSPTSSLYPPKDDNLRVCTVGDSIDASTGAAQAGGGWQYVAGKLLGWSDVRAVSFGSSGFCTAPAHGNTFASAGRIADVVAHNPDLIIITISQNDEPYTATTFPTEALAGFRAYRAAFPTTPIVVVGADASSSGPSASRLAIDAAGKAAFDAWADGRSWWIPNCNAVDGSWFTGTGTTASKTGTGNRDLYGSDAAHPNDAGHLYNARRFAAAFRQIVLPTL